MARFRPSSFVGFSLALVLAVGPLGAQEKKGAGRPGAGFGAGMFGGGEVSRLGLLAREQVQNEIKITPEQKDKLGEIQKGLRELRTAGGNTKDLSQDEKKKRFAEAREKSEKLTAEGEKKLEGILKPEQTKRLEEIYLQQRGVQALKDAKVAKELKLSEEQVGKVDAAITWGQEERRKLFADGAGRGKGREAFAELREKGEKIQKEADAKVLASLTDAQKEQFEKMKGSPFTLERGGNRGQPGAGAGGGAGRRGGKAQQ